MLRSAPSPGVGAGAKNSCPPPTGAHDLGDFARSSARSGRQARRQADAAPAGSTPRVRPARQSVRCPEIHWRELGARASPSPPIPRCAVARQLTEKPRRSAGRAASSSATLVEATRRRPGDRGGAAANFSELWHASTTNWRRRASAKHSKALFPGRPMAFSSPAPEPKRFSLGL